MLHSQSKGEEADAVNRVMFISLALPIFELKMVLAVADRKRRGTIVVTSRHASGGLFATYVLRPTDWTRRTHPAAAGHSAQVAAGAG